MSHALEAPLAPLLRDYRELRAAGGPFVLATIVSTAGSTYRKAGAQMLVTRGAETRGLLSGGCLEVDLVEHAREVLESGVARLARYDMRGEGDLLFGIGSGCEGAMEVLLQRVGPAESWQPLAQAADCADALRTGSLAIVVDGESAGRAWWDGGGNVAAAEPEDILRAREAAAASGDTRLVRCRLVDGEVRVLALPLAPPPGLLLCGAGVDAAPLARLAIALGFAVTVCDHRTALVSAVRFPDCRLCCQPASELARVPELTRAAAAIVMSHHLESDLAYLRVLAARPAIGYVGLLGPRARRERLLGELGADTDALRARLHAPLGLDIGAHTPEAIALAAAAELHAWLAGRSGGPWRTPR